jgi:outer membrane protein TolC
MFDWVKISFTASVLIHGGTLTAQEIHRLSVKQAIEYGTLHNVLVKNAGLDYKAQEQVNRGVTSQALPQVTGTLGVTDNVIIPTTLIPGEFVGQPTGTFVPVQFGTQYNSYATVTLKQTLFDGQVLVGLQARKTAMDWIKKSGEVTEQKLRVNIYKLYYALLLSNTQVALINANIDNQQALLHDATAMYKSGFSEKLDVDRAKVQLSNLEAQRVGIMFNIENANLALKAVLAMPVKDSLVLTDTITYEMVKAGSLSDTLGVYSQRRDYQYLELTKKLNEFDVKRYKKTYIPTLALTVNYAQNAYGEQWRVFKSGVWYGSSYGGLSVNIPIFDGFLKDANVQKAKITLRETENLLNDKKLSIDNDIKQAQTRFKAAMENLNSQKGNMELAQSVYDQTRKKYEQGVGSNTEITTALRDLTQSQNSYIDALFSAVQAKIDYQDAIGKL